MPGDPSQETSGWCGACRVIFDWIGKLAQRDADCPRCGLPLGRKPRGNIGRHERSNQIPHARQETPAHGQATHD